MRAGMPHVCMAYMHVVRHPTLAPAHYYSRSPTGQCSSKGSGLQVCGDRCCSSGMTCASEDAAGSGFGVGGTRCCAPGAAPCYVGYQDSGSQYWRCCGAEEVCGLFQNDAGTYKACCPSDKACGTSCCNEEQFCGNADLGVCCTKGDIYCAGTYYCCSPGYEEFYGNEGQHRHITQRCPNGVEISHLIKYGGVRPPNAPRGTYTGYCPRSDSKFCVGLPYNPPRDYTARLENAFDWCTPDLMCCPGPSTYLFQALCQGGDVCYY